ncbi:MAG: hypothetical protein GY719_31865 [bacterium]|nr:hypothetical protein [bacterium]
METTHKNQHSNAAIDCPQAVELLPWLLNGTLESEEREELLGHLESCDGCRRELDEAAVAWQLLNRHVPSLAIAEYAHGLEPSDLSRERLEKHLALCPSCRQEIEFATPDQVVDLDAARIERSIAARRPDHLRRTIRGVAAGVAASITLALVSGAIILDWRENAGTAPNPTAEARPAERHDSKPALGATGVFDDGFESGAITTWSSVTLDDGGIANADS